MFLGYPSGTKGWRVYDLETHRFFHTRDIAFDETIFPFAPTPTNQQPTQHTPTVPRTADFPVTATPTAQRTEDSLVTVSTMSPNPSTVTINQQTNNMPQQPDSTASTEPATAAPPVDEDAGPPPA